jgi:hypothetical protein
MDVYVETTVRSFAFADDAPEGPTMQEVRRARAEVYQEDHARSAQDRQRDEEQLARDFGLELRPGRSDAEERPRRTA